jgi:hypothetical protein
MAQTAGGNAVLEMHPNTGLWLVLILGLASAPAVRGADGDGDDSASFAALGSEYSQSAQPLIRTFCFECHASDVAEGGLDLERFARIDDLRPASKVWLKVAELLDTGEMPPEDAEKALATPERKQLRDWVGRYLKADARATAGDPGPVVLRRLTNAQYTYTIRDLTGLPLDPAREFPTDSAAGEGFTNTGSALVMSPSLLAKYFEAAKAIADHAALLPDGFRFFSGSSARDYSDETMSRIRDFYGRFTEATEGNQVNLQGIVFNTNGGGRLPVEKYLGALLDEREALRAKTKTLSAVSRERGLSPRYLGRLWTMLEAEPAGTEPGVSGPLSGGVRKLWREARPGNLDRLLAQISPWQQALWRFTSVGQIGKIGGPKAWMEPVSPLAERVEIAQDFRDARPDSEGLVHLYLAVGDAGDGSSNDIAIWEKPRLVTPGRADLPLHDVRDLVRYLSSSRREALAHAADLLDAASSTPPAAPDLLAEKLQIAPELVAAWYGYLGVGTGPAEIPQDAYLRNPFSKGGGYDFIQGFDSPDLPSIFTNLSDRHVRIPGNMKPHGVAVHPTPDKQVAVAWRSPMAGAIWLSATVAHAHPECGNGVTWVLELRKGSTRQRLAAGVAQGGTPVKIGPFDGQPVTEGDLLCLAIGPRDGNHACDLTSVDMTIKGGDTTWDLAADVSPNILTGNPHADSHGHAGVWHFYREPDNGPTTDTVIPTGSLLAKWRDAPAARKKTLAREIQELLRGPAPAADTPDGALYRQIESLRGPLLGRIPTALPAGASAAGAGAGLSVGLDPDRFGHLADGTPIDPLSLAVESGSVIDVALPVELLTGSTFVSGGALRGTEGSVQFFAKRETPSLPPGPVAGTTLVAAANSKTWNRLAADLDAFRQLFPPALCYTRIVPVDEVITLSLHYREDDLLRTLMLDDAQAAELDRLWNELRFVSHDALATVDAFQQLLEYASQDADPKVFEPLRLPLEENAVAFRQALAAAEPKQLDAVVDFAALAYRRPLADAEAAGLRSLYRSLRAQEVPHDDAIRLVLARVLVSPEFLYRLEKPGTGKGPAPVSTWEEANRLSYFLWSSQPDAELRERAAAGDLSNPDVLISQAHRMMKDERTRRLAEEFACQWLQVYDFPALDEKSEQHFPTFRSLRGAMYEETIRVFQDLFQNDRSVLDLVDADATFLNEDLARHYGIAGVSGPEFRRVEGVRRHGRGGILGLATTLAKQSGASRTSPILRGNWISEVVLGEKLPRPPKDVPRLPEDETATDGLTVRQLVEKHTTDVRCAGCHARIDPFGFALEGYDAIGRFRDHDLADRPIDTHTRLPDGSEIDGVDGLRQYLLTVRLDTFVHQFCRKLLGYALGRGVQLSDEPLLEEMQTRLQANTFHVSTAVDAIVRSRQFREIRSQTP